MAETGKATSQEFQIQSIVLENINGSPLVIYPTPKDDDVTMDVFHGMHISESIFEPTVRGSITVRDSMEAFESFNPVGGEFITIKAFTPNPDGEPESDSHILDCKFIVYNTTKISNESSESISGPAGSNSYIKMDFCTPEYYINKQDETYLEDDFIGPIVSEDGEGLINILSNKYFDNGDGQNRSTQSDKIEPTANSIWLKKNNLMYPWGKSRSNPDLFSMLDNVAENSLSAQNPNAANYLFYNTTKGYAFESVNNMIIRGNNEEIKEYNVDLNKPDDPNTVEYVASLSDYDHMALWQNGGYSSYYTNIKPDFSDPYFDHLDYNESHKKIFVDYQYHRDFDKIEHIEEHKLLPETIVADRTNGKQFYDTIYGYFGEHHNEANRHTDVTILNYEDGYGNLVGKPDKNTWQNMFDISSLPIDTLKTIKEIKEQVVEKKQEYARLRNLRNKFDTYECSVCCLTQPPGVTGAIDDYNIVSAGSFSDVVDWKKEQPLGEQFRLSYEYGEGATGPWNETLGQFYYLKREVPDFSKYVIDLEITRLQTAILANEEYLNACQNGPWGTADDVPECGDCYTPEDVRGFKCWYCNPEATGDFSQCNGLSGQDYILCVDNIDEAGAACAIRVNAAQSALSRLRDRLEEWIQYKEEFLGAYDRHWNKRAYFISKQPEIDKLNITTTPHSLFNVKSVQRKSLRGSRYEQFARKYNVRDELLGEWLYNAYLGNDPSIDPTALGGHPIYDQKYMDFETAGPSAFRDSTQRWWGEVRGRHQNFYCRGCCRNPDEFPCDYITYSCPAHVQPETFFYGGPNVTMEELDQHRWQVGWEGNPCEYGPSSEVYQDDEQGPPWGVIAPQWHPNNGEILLPNGFNPYDYSQRYNFYINDIAEYKPVSIKRKEVQSYVRVEFETPIGLETLDEYPEGFIRDAGYEYFLPYLVMITPGPYGKQGVHRNMAVIGIDPYGFDVALEPDEAEYGENTADDSMNLYPTDDWETERPFYTTAGNRGNWWGDGYDYYGDGYNPAPYAASLNRKGNAYSLLSKSSVDVSSGAPNSYYHFEYSPPPGVYYNGRRYYGYYGYYGGYNYAWWRYRYRYSYGWYWNRWYNYYDNYFYDTYQYPEFDETDSDVGNNASGRSYGRYGWRWRYWWNSSWFYGYSYIWQRETEYSSTLGEEDVWKRDSTGNTEYGMVEPKHGHDYFFQRQNEKQEMGRNFAAQFVVFSRRNVNTCSDAGYRCANPDGPVSSLGCPEDNPYCNCPCQDLVPRNERVVSREELYDLGIEPPTTGVLSLTEYLYFIVDQENNIIESFEGLPGSTIDEVFAGGLFSGFSSIQEWLEENGSIAKKPTDDDLQTILQETRECELISDELGESWLGCLYSNLDDSISCNCPCRGDNFSKYVEYTRTWSTYWDTPLNTPLIRNAQMLQLSSQKCAIVVNGDFSVQPGDIIRLNIPLVTEGAERQTTRTSGKWLVSAIAHTFSTQQTHRMILSLVRDTSSVSPDELQEPNWFANILGLG